MSELRPFRQRRAGAAAPAAPDTIDEANSADDPLSAMPQPTLQPIEGDARLDFASESDIAGSASVAVATVAPPALPLPAARRVARSTRSLALAAAALVLAVA